MDVAPDLDAAALGALLGGRPVRSYPALLSTEADALAWARAGAPAGAVVVADYQASPRGRAGAPWQVVPGRDLGFSLVVRPRLPSTREGWLYTVATVAVAEVLDAGDGDHLVEWPDTVVAAGRRAAAVAVTADPHGVGVTWAVVNVVVPEAGPPRGPLLAALVAAVEARLADEPAAVVDEHRRRCATLGTAVRARLLPLGPAGVVVEGRAVDVRDDGSLVVEPSAAPPAGAGARARVAVRPQHLGVLESA